MSIWTNLNRSEENALGLIRVMTLVTLSEPVQGEPHPAPDFRLDVNAAAVGFTGSLTYSCKSVTCHSGAALATPLLLFLLRNCIKASRMPVIVMQTFVQAQVSGYERSAQFLHSL